MSDPRAPGSSPDPTGAPDPNPRAGGERRRLDRAPSERYAPRAAAGPAGAPSAGAPSDGRPARRTRAIVAAAAVADIGALLLLVAGQLGLGVGLVVIAGFTGWATALALVWWGRDALPPALRTGLAVGLGAWSVVAGLLADWVFANVIQQGVLGPLDYVGQVYGIVAPLAFVAAVLVAWLRAR